VRLAIMQPYVFPYIGYFQLIHSVERFVVYDDVAFIKQGWINRNRILINGQAAFFNVPVKNASSFVPIRNTLIDDGDHNPRWREKLLRTFEIAYRRSPEFNRVFPLIDSVFNHHATHIGEIAVASLKAVMSYLEIKTDWVDSSVGLASDFRSEDRVVAICKTQGASEYVNPSGGKELYSRERFERDGLRLRFLDTRPIEYKQFSDPFVPWLSVIDVLMFNSVSVVRSYLERYDLT
jgi:WbqC-like protein